MVDIGDSKSPALMAGEFESLPADKFERSKQTPELMR